MPPQEAAPLQASDGREWGSLSMSEGVPEASAKAGTDSPSRAPQTGVASAGAGPTNGAALRGAVGAGDSSAGPALRDFAAMLSRKKRHFFMISNGGIPIYSRHGRTHDAASISALLYSIVSLSLDALGAGPMPIPAGSFARPCGSPGSAKPQGFV